MGYTIRTATWRYTEWIPFNPTTFEGNWTHTVTRELYDTENDADCLENLCAEGDCGAYAAGAERLAKALRSGWRAALPMEGIRGHESRDTAIYSLEGREQTL